MLTRVPFGKDTFRRSHFVKGAREGGLDFEELGLEVISSGVGCDVVGGGGCCGASGEFLGLGGGTKVGWMGPGGGIRRLQQKYH
jgi:hypothetical protein